VLQDSFIDKSRWNEIVASGYGHIFQTFHWARVLEQLGTEACPFMLDDKCILMAYRHFAPVAGSLSRKYSVLEVLRGPVFKDNRFDREAFEQVISRLSRYARSQGVLSLDIYPSPPATDLESASFLHKLGLHPVYDLGLHTQTYLIDCSRSEEELLRAMEERTRRSIRRAERLGGKVRDGTDATLLDSFFHVYRLTNPSPKQKSYFELVNTMLGEQGLARIFTLEVEGHCAAATFALMFGNVVFYVWGGSDPSYRKYYPGGRLHWETIKWSRSHGFKFYDFHGALTEDLHKYGVDQKKASIAFFKKGFGGTFVKYLPHHRVVISPARYSLVMAVRKALSGVRDAVLDFSRKLP